VQDWRKGLDVREISVDVFVANEDVSAESIANGNLLEEVGEILAT